MIGVIGVGYSGHAYQNFNYGQYGWDDYKAFAPFVLNEDAILVSTWRVRAEV